MTYTRELITQVLDAYTHCIVTVLTKFRKADAGGGNDGDGDGGGGSGGGAGRTEAHSFRERHYTAPWPPEERHRIRFGCIEPCHNWSLIKRSLCTGITSHLPSPPGSH